MESKCTGCGRHNVFAVTADGDGMAFDFVHERDCLLRKLGRLERRLGNVQEIVAQLSVDRPAGEVDELRGALDAMTKRAEAAEAAGRKWPVSADETAAYNPQA